MPKSKVERLADTLTEEEAADIRLAAAESAAWAGLYHWWAHN